ncbi:hypothetical protein Tco_0232563 [Tanacetum coccineum]
MRTKQRDGKYKHTVDLAKTTFGMRANSCVRELNQKLWDENQVREEPLSATFVAVEKFTEEAGIFSGCYVIGDGNPAGIGHLDELSSIVMIEPYSVQVIVPPQSLWVNFVGVTNRCKYRASPNQSTLFHSNEDGGRILAIKGFPTGTNVQNVNFSNHVGPFPDHSTLCRHCYDVIAGQAGRALAAVTCAPGYISNGQI